MARLVEALNRLPGIGQRSAERIVFYLLKTPFEEVNLLSELLKEVREEVKFCKECRYFSDSETCHICEDPTRDRSILCVVEDPKDVIQMEKTGAFNGLYHVLLGNLSPLEGIGPEELQIRNLIRRVKEEKFREVILATNPDTEGEATALYLAQVLKPYEVKVSRIARGIPVGSAVEFMDPATLQRALEGRQNFD
ncbi:MAG: recombination protein RecR [Candidatus Omnitrophica bacterium]|nr:recombination protein RecR [Candidatus Omnitrophota bacterium]